MIKNILLDLDDTLLDFGAAEHAALTRAFAEFGISTDEAVMRRYSEINANCWRRLERGEISRPEGAAWALSGAVCGARAARARGGSECAL